MTLVATLQMAPTTDRDANLAAVATLLDSAAAQGARIVLLPELFSVPFVPAVPGDAGYLRYAESLDGPSNRMVAAKSAEHGITVISSIFEASGVPGVFHNTASTFVAGERVLDYRKSHLPLSNAFPEKYYFRPGELPPSVVQTPEAALSTVICYERHFPELVRTAAVAGAELVAIPVASATAYSRTIYDIELRAHAVFNCLYVMAANRIGDEGDKPYFGGSGIFGPDGQDVARAEDTGGDEVVIGDIDLAELPAKRLTQRPFLRDRRTELYG